jgi:HEPN domain-containing protein
MDEAKRDYIRQWLDRASNDLQSARKLASVPDPLLDTAFYHCQQAAEKAVKGYLCYRDHPLIKTHNVGELVELAAAYESLFLAWLEAAEKLTPYATAFRYPPRDEEPDEERYHLAEQAAAGIFDFVRSLLPTEGFASLPNPSRDELVDESELHTIYVYLLDEDVDVWRPIQAKRVGESVFQIAEQEYDKSVDKWEFGPGEIVFCEPAQLSEGVCLVAKRRI